MRWCFFYLFILYHFHIISKTNIESFLWWTLISTNVVNFFSLIPHNNSFIYIKILEHHHLADYRVTSTFSRFDCHPAEPWSFVVSIACWGHLKGSPCYSVSKCWPVWVFQLLQCFHRTDCTLDFWGDSIQINQGVLLLEISLAISLILGCLSDFWWILHLKSS